MPYEFDYLEELSTLQDFETEQTNASVQLNTVRGADLPDGAFNAFHLDDPVVAGGKATERHVGGEHTYDATADTCLYTAYGLNGLGDRTVVGTPVGGPAYAGPAATLSVSWDPAGIQACALALANVEIKRVQEVGTDDDEAVIFCFQIEQGGTWRTLDTSERFYSYKDHSLVGQPSDLDADVGLFALLDQNTLPDGDTLVTGIRVCMSVRSTSPSCDVTLDRWNMSFLPLLAVAG